MKAAKRLREMSSFLFRDWQLLRMKLERLAADQFHPERNRILATACWSFPIYSQTFVYQELTQLIKHGFDLRFLYTKLDSRKQLSAQFNPIWHARRKMILHPKVCQQDFAYYNARMPDKIETLVQKICAASGVTPEELKNHHHFNEAFSFVRLVEAYRPAYLHSYFFYEGTFFTFIASYLLNIPRGVSCYADHMLNDYEFKMVPLHLQQCEVVIATSMQIRNELQKIYPNVDLNRILVKPNAINASAFPMTIRKEPGEDEPFQIVSVCRIEPKKGLIYLVEAVRLLQDKGLNVHLYHLGGVDHAEYFDQLKSKIKEFKVENRIHLKGPQPESEILKFLNRAQICIAPFVETEFGDKDGIPTSLLEGMASGIPVVATNSGSIPEVIEHGRDGLLVAQRDAKALAEAIISLRNDPEKRKLLGANGAAKIRERYDVSVCERDFHERLTAILGSKNELT